MATTARATLSANNDVCGPIIIGARRKGIFQIDVTGTITLALKSAEESVPLSASGDHPATHFGSHFWGADIPEAREGETISAEDGAAPLVHFMATLADQNLKRIENAA